jgi:hypothetical protein
VELVNHIHQFLTGQEYQPEQDDERIEKNTTDMILSIPGADYFVDGMIPLGAESVVPCNDGHKRLFFVVNTDSSLGFRCVVIKRNRIDQKLLVGQSLNIDLSVYRLVNGQLRIVSDGLVYAPEKIGVSSQLV